MNEMRKFEPIKEKECFGGIKKVYRFANGYGASVVQNEYSYGGKEGKWELAILKFVEDSEDDNYRIDYSTDLTSDVIGYLDWDEVEKCLERISKIDPGINFEDRIEYKKMEIDCCWTCAHLELDYNKLGDYWCFRNRMDVSPLGICKRYEREKQ